MHLKWSLLLDIWGVFRFACVKKGFPEKLVLANIYQSILPCQKKEEQGLHINANAFVSHSIHQCYLLSTPCLVSELRYQMWGLYTLGLSVAGLLNIFFLSFSGEFNNGLITYYEVLLSRNWYTGPMSMAFWDMRRDPKSSCMNIVWSMFWGSWGSLGKI